VAKTPCIAAAEKAGITFAVHEYDHDPAVESWARGGGQARRRARASLQDTGRVAWRGARGRLRPGHIAAGAEVARQTRRARRQAAGGGLNGLPGRRHQPAGTATATSDAPRRTRTTSSVWPGRASVASPEP